MSYCDQEIAPLHDEVFKLRQSLLLRSNTTANGIYFMNITIIEEKFILLADKISAPQKYWPKFGHSISGSGHFVEIDKGNQICYIHTDRRQEITREFASDLEDLFYIIFKYITFWMSSEYELNHRIENEDSRRQKFSIQENLLAEINEIWREKCHSEHESILKYYPFDDMSKSRITYTLELKKNGILPQEAWLKAVHKYPLPNNNH